MWCIIRLALMTIRFATHTCLLIAEPTMTLQFSVDDLLRVLGTSTVAKGEFLWLDDRVRQVEVTAGGARISGNVFDSRPRPYGQTIMLASNGRAVTINGYCSCPVGVNCKHVAAVLLQHLEHQATDNASSVSATAPESFDPFNAATSKTPKYALPVRPIEPRATLSRAVTHWLDRLACATESPVPSDLPANSNQRQLRYVLNHEDATAGAPLVRIRLVTVRLRKDGSITDEKPYDPENVTRPKEQRARFLTETDCNHLRDLMWLKRARGNFGQADISLGPDAASVAILMALTKSGRLRFGRPSGPVLREGPARRAEPRWLKIGRNEQRLTLVAVAPAASSVGDMGQLRPENPPDRFNHVLPLNPPHYVDLTAGQIGVIETTLPPHIAVEVAGAPAIAMSEAAIVKEMMRQRLGTKTSPAQQVSMNGARHDDRGCAEHLPLPEAPDNVEIRAVTPVPRLELMVASVRLKSNHFWDMNYARRHEAFSLPVARLSFDYDGEIVPSTSPVQTLERVDADQLILTPRDMQVEQKAGARLARLGVKALNSLPFDVPPQHAGDLIIAPAGHVDPYRVITSFIDPARFIAFSTDCVPLLVKDGCQVAFSDDYPYRISEGDPRWWADVGEGSGIDWFSFDLGSSSKAIGSIWCRISQRCWRSCRRSG